MTLICIRQLTYTVATPYNGNTLFPNPWLGQLYILLHLPRRKTSKMSDSGRSGSILDRYALSLAVPRLLCRVA